MFVIPLILAAGSLPTLTSGAPVPSFLSGIATGEAHPHSLNERSANAYKVYGGTGAVSDGWPSMNDWVSSFETMFEANKVIMQSSCSQWGVENNSDNEINDISSGILAVASSSGVDPRFILAIVLQESNGCVRAPTTNYGVVNPGLMQSHAGSGSCSNGGVLNPCPAGEITQMITDGTAGTSSGDGLKQCITKSGATDVSQYYKAARIYNSGSIDPTNNLGRGIATHCYASDVANRLTGWTTAANTCDPNTVGDLNGVPVAAGTPAAGAPATSSASIILATSTPAAVPIPVTNTLVSAANPTNVLGTTSVEAKAVAGSTTTASLKLAIVTSTVVAGPTTTASPKIAIVTSTVVVVPLPATTTTSAASAPISTSSTTPIVSSTDPIYPYAISSCQKYYTVVAGDDCLLVEAKFGISESQLISWNSGLDEACTNLWLGYQYCVEA